MIEGNLIGVHPMEALCVKAGSQAMVRDNVMLAVDAAPPRLEGEGQRPASEEPKVHSKPEVGPGSCNVPGHPMAYAYMLDTTSCPGGAGLHPRPRH